MNDETKAKIKAHYNLGEGSIQDIARVYRLSVEEVLEVLNLSELMEIETSGDLIDQTEAGPEVTLKISNKFRTKFTTN